MPAIPYTIGGNATIDTGAAVDMVQIVSRTGAIHQAVPETNGDWEDTVYAGVYDIMYMADGYQTVCHGPYTIPAP